MSTTVATQACSTQGQAYLCAACCHFQHRVGWRGKQTCGTGCGSLGSPATGGMCATCHTAAELAATDIRKSKNTATQQLPVVVLTSVQGAKVQTSLHSHEVKHVTSPQFWFCNECNATGNADTHRYRCGVCVDTDLCGRCHDRKKTTQVSHAQACCIWCMPWAP